MNLYDRDDHDVIFHIEDNMTQEMSEEIPPLVSIYIPLHHNERTHRQSRWDASMLTMLVQRAERELEKIDWSDMSEESRQQLLANLAALKERTDVRDMLDAPDIDLDDFGTVAFFVSAAGIHAMRLHITVPDGFAQVADTWFTKPLIRNAAAKRSFFVLALGADRSVLAQGDETRLFAPYIPFIGSQDYAEDRSESDGYDGDPSALDYYTLDGHDSQYAGHKSRNDVRKEDAEKFFRDLTGKLDAYLDARDLSGMALEGVPEDIATLLSAPVIICGVPEHKSTFDEIIAKMARKDRICSQWIEKDAAGLGSEELHELAVGILNERIAEERCQVREKISGLIHNGLASEDIREIANAAASGRVGRLIIGAGKEDAKSAEPDMIDAIVQAAIATDAVVEVWDREEMPNGAAVAAIMRWSEKIERSEEEMMAA